MGDRKMLSRDVEWYVTHLEQIATFQRWIDITKTDLPKQLAQLVRRSAVAAVDQMGDGENDFSDRSFPMPDQLVHPMEYEVFWKTSDGFDEKKQLGAYISVSIPKDVDWLTSEGDERPTLDLCYFGKSNADAKEIGKYLSDQLGSLRRDLGMKVNRLEEDRHFICVQRELCNELSADNLRRANELQASLTKLFKDFTVAVAKALFPETRPSGPAGAAQAAQKGRTRDKRGGRKGRTGRKSAAQKGRTVRKRTA
jgi:hypothetical protein